MSAYLYPIEQAVKFFPFAALLITFPFIIHKYRKYGAVHFLYFLCIYLFIFYIMCVFCLVLLPLPEVEEVAQRTTDYCHLKPFSYVQEILVTSSVNLSRPESLVSFIMNTRWLEPLFNILMLIPFGIFARYYRRWSWYRTLRYAFYLSLLFEITQLSGLFLMYPRPYRLFDINDLIENTAGGLAGWFIEPLFTAFLPKREKIDRMAYINGSVAGFGRRLTALFIDFIAVSICTDLICAALPVKPKGIIAAVIMTAVIYITHGYSLGKKAVRLRVVHTETGTTPRLTHLFIRELIIWGWLIGIPLFVDQMIFQLVPGPVLMVLWLISVLAVLYDAFQSRSKADKQLFFEEYLKIANIPVFLPKASLRVQIPWKAKDYSAVFLTLMITAVFFLFLPKYAFEEYQLSVYHLLVNPVLCASVGYYWTVRPRNSFEVPLFSPLIYVVTILIHYDQSGFYCIAAYELCALMGMLIGAVMHRRRENRSLAEAQR